MREQLSIFNECSSQAPVVQRQPTPPRARRDDPATSQLAAQQARILADDHRGRILEAMQAFGPGTIYELAYVARLTHVQVARRMPELKNTNDVRVRIDETRASPTGRQCRVWELVS